MRRLKAEPWLALVGFGALSLLLRFTAFSRSVIDWDESLFLLMGRAVLRGEIPYVTIWEHSPVGGAVLFAAAQWLFGESVLAIRLLTWLAVSLTCWLLYVLANDLVGSGRVGGIVAGLCYAVYSLNNNGQAAHRELLFAPLMVSAVWLLIGRRFETEVGRERRTTARLLAAGFLLGVGLQLKYLFIWEWVGAAAIALLSVLADCKDGHNKAAGAARALILLAVGPVSLVGAVTLCFVLNGHIAEFIRANFVAGAAYLLEGSFDAGVLARKLRYQVISNILPWLGVLLAPVHLFSARHLSRSERRVFLYIGIWFIFALVDAVFTQRLFGHHFLQILPPLCVLLGLVVAGALGHGSSAPAACQKGVLIALILLGPLVPRAYPEAAGSLQVLYRQFISRQQPVEDTPAQVARYLRQQMGPNETLFVVDYEPIVYYLVDAEVVTQYLFTSHLTDEVYRRADGIDQSAEIEAVFARQPTYVVRRTPKHGAFTNMEVAARVDAHLKQGYALEAALPGIDVLNGQPITVEIYRLIGGSSLRMNIAVAEGRLAHRFADKETG